MLYEKQNEYSWRNDLDELNSLPGESQPSYHSVWDKLELRLNKKETSKRKLWYFVAAAASLVSIVILAGINFNGKNQLIAPANIVQNNSLILQSEKQRLQEVKEQLPLITASSIKEKKSAKSIQSKSITNKEDVFPKDDAIAIIPAMKEDSVKDHPLVMENITRKPIVFPSLKKKIPVVHLNELEKPITPVEAVAGNGGRSLRDRFFRNDLSNETDPPISTNGNVITIKLSPQN